MVHEVRHELVRREASDAPILGRDDHVETSEGRGDDALPVQPSQGGPGGDDRRSEASGEVARREVVATSGRQVIDEIFG